MDSHLELKSFVGNETFVGDTYFYFGYTGLKSREFQQTEFLRYCLTNFFPINLFWLIKRQIEMQTRLNEAPKHGLAS